MFDYEGKRDGTENNSIFKFLLLSVIRYGGFIACT